jgi:hypothetical protein
MKFSGRLQVEGDPRNWLRADLTVGRGRVELTAGSDVLGTWSTSQVTAERVEGDRFALHLGEEKATFMADDALGFSYEALPQLNKRPLLPVGGMMDKIKSGLRPDEPKPEEEALSAPPPERVESPAVSTGKRLRELIKEAASQPVESPSAWTEPTSALADKRPHVIEGLLKWRPGARDHEERMDPLPAESPDPARSADDLLERLFAPASQPDPEPVQEPPVVPASLWAEPVTTWGDQAEAEAESNWDEEMESLFADPVSQEPEPEFSPLAGELFGEAGELSDPPFGLADNEAGFLTEPVSSLADASPALPEPTSSPSPDASPTPPEPTPGHFPTASLPSPAERMSTFPTSSPPSGAEPVSDFPTASPSLPAEPSATPTAGPETPLVTALEKVVAEVKAGSLTPDQVEAITGLIRAVAEAVRPSA